MDGIYLDYASTTPVSEDVLKKMAPYQKDNFGNASSIHKLGQISRTAIDSSRETIAKFLNCLPSEVIFTGSATESDNIAILGVADFYLKQGKKIHIVTSKIEHHAVLTTCEALEKQGVGVTYLPVNQDGMVDVNKVSEAIKENTVLVSIMYANNEIGSIQPIAKISEAIKNKKPDVLFHTDAVQGVNYLTCNVKELGVDMLTLSGHKIYGPKGVGALYLKQGIKITPIVYGGGHEYGLRPGTENTAYIVGLAVAIQEAEKNMPENGKIQKLRDKLINGVLKNIPDSKLNGSKENRLPNNANFSFKGAEGEAIVISLDQEQIYASTGSACTSQGLEPSHVLLAIGLQQEQAHSSLRLTLGKHTTEKEIKKVLDVLPKVISRLREVSGYIEMVIK